MFFGRRQPSLSFIHKSAERGWDYPCGVENVSLRFTGGLRPPSIHGEPLRGSLRRKDATAGTRLRRGAPEGGPGLVDKDQSPLPLWGRSRRRGAELRRTALPWRKILSAPHYPLRGSPKAAEGCRTPNAHPAERGLPTRGTGELLTIPHSSLRGCFC